MLKKTISFLAAGAFCAAALSQATLGTVSRVEGLVTVGVGANVTTAQVGAPVLEGSRYVTGSTGAVTLELDRCNVELRANQMVTVEKDRSCAALLASIQTLTSEQAVVVTGVSRTAVVTALIGTGLAVAAVAGGSGSVPATGGGGTGGGGGIPNQPVSGQ